MLWLGSAVLSAASVIQFFATGYKVNESDAQAVLRVERSGDGGLPRSDLAISLFQQAYGTNYQPMGTERIIEIMVLNP